MKNGKNSAILKFVSAIIENARELLIFFTHLRTHSGNNQLIIIWGAEITGSF